MQQRQSIPIPSLKRLKNKIKHNVIGSSPKATKASSFGKEIKPIPFLRHNVMNNPQRSHKLLLKGYKHFSKLVASGEQTFHKLSMIKRSHSIKHIKHFEFDAFLCEKSCLRQLCSIFNKLKMATSLKFIIRRVERLNESNLLEPFLRRVKRLKGIHLEFPGTEKVDSGAVLSISKSLSKCYLMETLVLDFSFLPLLSGESFLCFGKYFKTFKRLKTYRFTKLIIPHKALQIQKRQENTFKYPLRQLESVSTRCGLKSGWVEKNLEEEDIPAFILGWLPCTNLRDFHFHFQKMSLSPEALVAFSVVLPQLPKLQNISCEFVSCDLGDLEFRLLSQIILRLTHIKRYTYKVTQRPNVKEEQVIDVANSLSKMNNLEKFDVLFRGTALVNAGELTDQLFRIKDINFDLTKSSVYLYRDKTQALSLTE